MILTQTKFVSYSWDEAPPAVRTRPEAGDISEKSKGDYVGHLMHGEVTPPTVRETKLPPHMTTAETPYVPQYLDYKLLFIKVV